MFIALVYLSTREVQERYRISRATLYRWQESPAVRFPTPVKIGQRTLWRENDLQDFDARAAAGQTAILGKRVAA